VSPLISVEVGGQKEMTDPLPVDMLTNSDDLTHFNKHFFFELKDQVILDHI
jgi:hypothetical protein